jgi:hypothetical protein
MTLAWGKPGCTSMHVLIDCAQDRGMWMGGSTPVKSPRLKVGYRRYLAAGFGCGEGQFTTRPGSSRRPRRTPGLRYIAALRMPLGERVKATLTGSST